MTVIVVSIICPKQASPALPSRCPLPHKLWTARAAARGSDIALVFPSTNGTPLNSANLYKPAARRAGVPWATFHTLRHTTATLLFRNGYNAKQVQAWLGHHAASFTLDVYVHLLPDDLPEAAFFDRVSDARLAAAADATDEAASQVAEHLGGCVAADAL